VTVRRSLPSSLALLTTTAVLLAVAPAGAEAASACRNADARPTSISHGKYARAVRCLVNQARRRHGIRAVRANKRLTTAARRHSNNMVRFDFFAHVSPSGDDLSRRVARVRYGGRKSWSAGETLAWGIGRKGTPRRLVRSWLNSPGHRGVVLNPRWRHVGIGAVYGAPNGNNGRAVTVAAAFGHRR
jgi:uncharacterized protein YkwD